MTMTTNDSADWRDQLWHKGQARDKVSSALKFIRQAGYELNELTVHDQNILAQKQERSAYLAVHKATASVEELLRMLDTSKKVTPNE